jgi:transketolase N-terminal domain/subunit
MLKINDARVLALKKRAQEVRIEIIKMIYKAQSGHPGGSLSRFFP